MITVGLIKVFLKNKLMARDSAHSSEYGTIVDSTTLQLLFDHVQTVGEKISPGRLVGAIHIGTE
jgi:hypothetical protein